MQLGDFYQGGIVFHLDEVAGFGLIASLNDVTASKWRAGLNSDYPFANALGEDIGDGLENTKKIVNYQGEGDYAAKICNHYSFAGYNDWFLPSKEEAKLMYNEKVKLDLIYGNFYWTSTEIDNDKAWIVCPSYDDSWYEWDKNSNYNVKPIRQFFYSQGSKTSIVAIRELFTHVLHSELMNDIKKPNGGLYKLQRPINSVKEDVVINSLDLGYGAVQKGLLNVNIYVPNIEILIDGITDRSQPNTNRLEYLGKLLKNSLGNGDEVWIDSTVCLNLQQDNIFSDENNQHYLNFRVEFYSLNIN